MSITNNNTGTAKNTSFISIFKDFLVNKPGSPPPDYLLEDEVDETTSSQSAFGIKRDNCSGSEKDFVNEKNVSAESITTGSTKKKKLKKKGKKVVKKKEVPTPIRTSSRRKAKDQTKSNLLNTLEEQDILDEPDLDSEFDLGDSDADPAWSPLKDDSDDDGNRRRGRRKRHVAPPSITSDSDDEPLAKHHKSTEKITVKTDAKSPKPVHNVQQKTTSPVPIKATEKVSAKSSNVPSVGKTPASSSTSLGLDFKPGEFVVMKEDLDRDHPPIWRLDGKTLLQKYEPFNKDGEMLYRNLTTFSGWTALSRPRFLRAPVKFRVQNRKEIIVDFEQNLLTLVESDYDDKISKDLEPLRDTFEVYIQTLVSHVLDPNFLPEIFREKDDYFLTNLKIIDDLAEKRKLCLKTVCQWKDAPLSAVSTWPFFKITNNTDLRKDKICVACDKSPAMAQMVLDGEPYNKETLEPCSSDAELSQELFLCTLCSERMVLYHKVTHQKYLLFVECAKQVFVKKGNAGQNITTILNDMLIDEPWLNEVIASIQDPLKAIDKVDQPNLRKIVAEKYQANRPTKI